MFDRITAYARKHQLFKEGSTVVLGLSGGPDSMFLLHYLASLRASGTIQIIAAHLDHGWRATSTVDAQFCKDQVQALNISCVVEHLSNIKPCRWNGSQEELGRKARRAFFERVAREHNADTIALAHHAQDQQETFFIRLMRASSIDGLSCMRPRAGMYVRPLLVVNKADILSYLHAHGIAYVVDETNSSADYLRNRIRATVLPAVRAVDERFDHNFAQTLARLQQAQAYIEMQARETFQRISCDASGTLSISAGELCSLHSALQYQLVRLWLTREGVPFTPTERFFQELLRFAQSKAGGKHQIHMHWSVVKRKGWIWVEK